LTPSAWIAFASLAGFIFIQGIGWAFLFGKLFQDVASIKASGPDRAVQGLAIARLEVEMGHVSTTLNEVSGKMDERLGFLQEPAVYAPMPRVRKPRGSE